MSCNEIVFLKESSNLLEPHSIDNIFNSAIKAIGGRQVVEKTV